MDTSTTTIYALFYYISQLQKCSIYYDLKPIITQFTLNELQTPIEKYKLSIFQLACSHVDSMYLAIFIISEYPDIDVNIHCYHQPLLHRVIQITSIRSNVLLEKLLECGADVNKTNNVGYTPLIVAVINENYEAIKLLLMYGAKPHYKDSKKYLSAYEFSMRNSEILKMFDDHINNKTKSAIRIPSS